MRYINAEQDQKEKNADFLIGEENFLQIRWLEALSLITSGRNFLKANSQENFSCFFYPIAMSEEKLLNKVLCQKNSVMNVFLESKQSSSVVLKFRKHQNYVEGVLDQIVGSWFSQSVMGLENVHFSQAPRWCCCWWWSRSCMLSVLSGI